MIERNPNPITGGGWTRVYRENGSFYETKETPPEILEKMPRLTVTYPRYPVIKKLLNLFQRLAHASKR